MKHKTLVSASILDADLSSLSTECRRALKAGADRIHLDVMDGHFVPNITFGPGLIARLRKIGKRPFDAHLMISEPGRYMDEFIAAGCDSSSFHERLPPTRTPHWRLTPCERMRSISRASTSRGRRYSGMP